MAIDPIPTLTTDRLVLRNLIASDQNEILRLRSDPGINKYLERPPAKSIQDAMEFINKIKQGTKDKEWIYWAITLKNKDKLIGTICLWNIADDDMEAEIGFELHPEYQGLGIMQEALPCILKYGFESLNCQLISGIVHPENTKSIDLLKNFHFVPDTEYKEVEGGYLRYIILPDLQKTSKDG